MKNTEKLEAIRLRKEEGLAINKIAEKLKVAKSSVSLWVRKVELTEEQKNKLLEQNPIFNGQRKGNHIQRDLAIIRRKCYQEDGRKKAKEKNILHAMGCMLYWAEGNKKNNKQTLLFSNSDPFMIRLFLEFLRKCFLVPDEKITITLKHYTDIVSLEEAHFFWLNFLKLPKECLRKATVNYFDKSNWTKNKRRGSMRYGVCRLGVYDVRIIQNIYGSIKEYGTIDKQDWPD